ncbi:hypothetical protein C4K38_0718 [Pseudomonas chlororaphis subsp. piscium]|nr:hypothetical protein C4K38_0718 [Pseudomonas chlororaphis subsp. piscium]AZD71108.1 hypothetical protein C4K16_0721 [Pseudomonas chlororaphis subsp. aurantiaca]
MQWRGVLCAGCRVTPWWCCFLQIVEQAPFVLITSAAEREN